MSLSYTIKYMIIMLGLSFIWLACRNRMNRNDETVKIIEQWQGRQILFPTNIQCNLMGIDTSCFSFSHLFSREYKILSYTDSFGCLCRVNFYDWAKLITESDTLFENKVGFLFFFTAVDKTDLSFYLRRDNMNYPIFIDENDSINILNTFPKSRDFHCFLLDKNNKVLAMGDPSTNPRVWFLYEKLISGLQK